MDEDSLQGIKCYTVDLAEIGGNGDIKCPKCGIVISPDDETEDAYTILETIMKEDSLYKLTVRCNKCQTEICLTGFQLLSEQG